jgi:hypothetical protein
MQSNCNEWLKVGYFKEAREGGGVGLEGGPSGVGPGARGFSPLPSVPALPLCGSPAWVNVQCEV